MVATAQVSRGREEGADLGVKLRTPGTGWLWAPGRGASGSRNSVAGAALCGEERELAGGTQFGLCKCAKCKDQCR